MPKLASRQKALEEHLSGLDKNETLKVLINNS